jgi:hypothetical protein
MAVCLLSTAVVMHEDRRFGQLTRALKQVLGALLQAALGEPEPQEGVGGEGRVRRRRGGRGGGGRGLEGRGGLQAARLRLLGLRGARRGRRDATQAVGTSV